MGGKKALPGSGMSAVILTALACLALSSSLASAQFSCEVKTSCTGDQIEVFNMWSTDNSHAEVASRNDYNYKVCCGGLGSGMLSLDCPDSYHPKADVVLRLSALTNAHVADPISSTSYPVYVCLNTQVGDVYCSIKSGCTGAGETCLASISSSTNAHVGDCDAYPANRVCCRANRPPEVTDITPPPGDNRGDIKFSASASDADGDTIQRVEFRVEQPSGTTNLPTDTSGPPWEATWESFDDTGPGTFSGIKVMARACDALQCSAWYEETFDVDNEPPVAWITLPTGTERAGKIFDVEWDGNSYATAFEFQYVDRGVFNDQSDWKPETPVQYSGNSHEMDLKNVVTDNPEYCFRVKGVDTLEGVPGEWSCNPSTAAEMETAGCTCVQLDTEEPDSAISLMPEYTNEGLFNVEWEGDDEYFGDSGAGVRCYQIQYRIVDSKNDGAVLQDWTDWDDSYIQNDEKEVLIGDECQTVKCIDAGTDSYIFQQDEVDSVSAEYKNDDSHTFEMRVRAIDDAYGCANIEEEYEENETGTWIDWTQPPDLMSSARDEDGTLLNDPNGILYVPDVATLNASADPDDEDYTGVVETGITYWLLKSGDGHIVVGDPDGTTVHCPDGERTCEVTVGPWDDDFKLGYITYAMDKAGNRNETEEKTFWIYKPLRLTTTTSDLYMTLGGSEILPLTISNRQNIQEEVEANIKGYPYAKFVVVDEENEGDLKLSADGRNLTVTLESKERRTVHVLVQTSEVSGDEPFRMLIYANSTRPGFESKVEDAIPMEIRVVFPQEFSGMQWPAAALLLIAAVLVYARLSSRD